MSVKYCFASEVAKLSMSGVPLSKDLVLFNQDTLKCIWQGDLYRAPLNAVYLITFKIKVYISCILNNNALLFVKH